MELTAFVSVSACPSPVGQQPAMPYRRQLLEQAGELLVTAQPRYL